MSKIIVRSAKGNHVETALRILMDLRVSHSKADALYASHAPRTTPTTCNTSTHDHMTTHAHITQHACICPLHHTRHTQHCATVLITCTHTSQINIPIHSFCIYAWRDQLPSAREGHERKRRLLFLQRQRRGYRSWAKFISDASESYDELQLQYETFFFLHFLSWFSSSSLRSLTVIVSTPTDANLIRKLEQKQAEKLEK